MRSRPFALALMTAAVVGACGRETRTVVHPVREAEVAQAPLPSASAPASAQIAPPEMPPIAAAQPEPAQAPPAVAASPATAELGAGRAPGFQGNPGHAEGAKLLAMRSLMVPVQGIPPESLMDTYEQSRGGRTHEAMDIAAPAGTPVVAVDDGRIAKLFLSKPGGLTVYQFDRDGQLAYYYAHLERYSQALHEGQEVKRGMVLGFVGSTGNADPKVPHLHFAIFKLGPERNWWQGDPVNPYPALRNGVPAQVAAR